jgi:List-Bact-rpt repeat protein/putative Ig domain-containing protein
LVIFEHEDYRSHAWDMRTPPALLLLFVLILSVAAHAAPVTISTTSLPNGNATVAYAATIATTGGTVPFKWAVSSGSLPPGLGLTLSGDTRSAVVSGIPSLASNYSFSVTVTGRWGHKSTVAYSVTISPQAGGLTLTVTMAGTGGGSAASSPTGIACPTTCGATFKSGAVVTLTATPDAGSNFAGWSGACTGTGTCKLTMNAAQSVTATFALLVSHIVDLSWSPSAAQNIVGYNVYRGTTAGGPYQRINPTLVASSQFTDSNVLNGATYHYVTTAIDNAGAESGYSNDAMAVVPQ